MKRISFYKENRSGNLLHIETELCVVNIRIGLTDNEGRQVTSVEILPNKYVYEKCALDGHSNNRVIRLKPGQTFHQSCFPATTF